MPSTRAIVPSISGCDPAETSLRVRVTIGGTWGQTRDSAIPTRFGERRVRHSILRFSMFRPVSAESVCWTFGFPASFGDCTVRIHKSAVSTQKFRVNTAKIFGELDPQRFTVGQNLSVVLSRRFIVGQNLSVVPSRRFTVGQNWSVVVSRRFIVGQNLSVVRSRRFTIGQNLSVVLSRRFIVGLNRLGCSFSTGGFAIA